MAEAFNKRDDVYGGTFIEGYCFHGDQRPLLVPCNWERVIASYCMGKGVDDSRRRTTKHHRRIQYNK